MARKPLNIVNTARDILLEYDPPYKNRITTLNKAKVDFVLRDTNIIEATIGGKFMGHTGSVDINWELVNTPATSSVEELFDVLNGYRNSPVVEDLIEQVTFTNDHALVESDNGKMLLMDKATAITVSVPLGLTPGFSVLIKWKGAGQPTIVPVSGWTMDADPAGANKINGQGGVATLIVESATVLTLSGDIAV